DIRRDPRHTDIYTLFEEPIDEREFANWAMAFHDQESDELSAVPGYSDFLSKAWSPSDGPAGATRARRLLAGFKEHLR
ncbi:MAG: BLUF domain-containing protein, partial [Planctomycetota bacterium]